MRASSLRAARAKVQVVIAETANPRSRPSGPPLGVAAVHESLSVVYPPPQVIAQACAADYSGGGGGAGRNGRFVSDAPSAIKWPNDILVDGKKLAGILTEAACDAERVDYVVLGVGLNVNYSVDAMPEELRHRATSMADLTGTNVSRESVLVRLIQDLDRCYGELEESGFEALRPRWEAHFALRGRRIQVELGGRTVIGRALGHRQGRRAYRGG